MTYFTTLDYNWVPIQTGFIAYREDRLYYIKMKIEEISKNQLKDFKVELESIEQIGFLLEKLDLTITTVIE